MPNHRLIRPHLRLDRELPCSEQGHSQMELLVPEVMGTLGAPDAPNNRHPQNIPWFFDGNLNLRVFVWNILTSLELV